MSKVDEMFEKLGYIEHFNTEYVEVFRTDSSHSMGHSIEFLIKSHKVFNTYNSITMEELQAINEKAKELRMELEELMKLLSEKVKRDRYGNLYIELKEFDKDLILKDLGKERYYLCLVNTVCDDFVKQYCNKEKYGFEHYNRHYINDDTLEIRVIKESKKKQKM